MDELTAVLAEQHGAITTGQALAAGLSRHAIAHRVASERWVRAHRGTYLTVTAAGDRTSRLVAGLLYAGHHATLRRWTAAEVHGLARQRGDVVELWVPATRSVTPTAGLSIRRTSCLSETDRRTVRGLAVTSIERTLLDLCAALRTERSRLALVAEVLQAGRTKAARLEQCLRHQPAVEGARRLEEILAMLRPGFESGLEQQLGRHLAAAGLRPVCQQSVTLLEGSQVRLDFAFPAERVNVEADGAAFHLTPAQRDADILRDEGLRRAGWEVVRASTSQIRHEPAAVVGRVRAALEERRRMA